MILFIDDERRIMNSYKEYLELKMRGDNHEVRFISDIDEALEFLEKHSAEIDLIVLDIMMPWGKQFSSEKTNGGLQTGVLFYERVRDYSGDLPVLVFTNYLEEDLEKRLEQDTHCRFLQKSDYLLDDFVSEVREILSTSSRSEGSSL
jgi:CheY-like chemotaxis protein